MTLDGEGPLRILLTGLPGSGKSTVLLRVVDNLRSRGFIVGGITTPDIRVQQRRTGFRVVDLRSGNEAVLASSKISSGPQLGQYRVDVKAFERVALPALEYAEKYCDFVCVDEIGKMEFFSQIFKEKIDKLFQSEKPVLAVVHRDFVGMYGKYGPVLFVTPENRERLVADILSLIVGDSRKI